MELTKKDAYDIGDTVLLVSEPLEIEDSDPLPDNMLGITVIIEQVHPNHNSYSVTDEDGGMLDDVFHCEVEGYCHEDTTKDLEWSL